jgi:uncharacterized membrane protein YphA (DoxX/SURF4 family)
LEQGAVSTETKVRLVRRIAAWLVGLYLARMYVEQGLVKLDPEGFWKEVFALWGYPAWLCTTVGVLEVAGGVAILLPWVAGYGSLALLVVMSGAAMTRIGDGRWVDVAWLVTYSIALAWIAWEWWPWRSRPSQAFRRSGWLD